MTDPQKPIDDEPIHGVIVRPDSRSFPFSLGGDVPPGSLLTNGPDPLYNVPLVAPDLKKLPQWDRRTYDAWTTQPFRALVLTWIAMQFSTHDWLFKWAVRERATAARLSTIRLARPLLIIHFIRKTGVVIEATADWDANERDNPTTVALKLEQMRIALEALNALTP